MYFLLAQGQFIICTDRSTSDPFMMRFKPQDNIKKFSKNVNLTKSQATSLFELKLI